MIAQDVSALWDRLVESRRAYASASREFLARKDRVEMLRESLRGEDRFAALSVARSLNQDEKMQLFAEWVYLASWAHGAIQLARDIILSLPRDWVLANIERESEPYLQDGTYDEYRRFLELYSQLDPELKSKLADRARQHSDPDIREAGEDFAETP